MIKDKSTIPINLIMRVKEDHNAYGVKLNKGMLVWLYDGETYEALAPDEVAVQIEVDGPFVGVPKSLLEPFTDDPIPTYIKALSFVDAEARLRELEQHYKDIGHFAMHEALFRMRKHIYLQLMTRDFRWTLEDATQAFDENELKLKLKSQMPYQINVSTKTIH